MTNLFKINRNTLNNQNKTYRESDPTMTRKNWNAPNIFAAAAMAVALPFAFAGDAKAQEACSVYTVKAGDSLGAISIKFFGSIEHYTKIYQANRGLLSSPDRIRIGQRLVIPNIEA